ncbi:hypothetical protein HGH92_15960 [Chitinophaga varians]|uniref:Uncharacterized protein n=1 Tax=Chitinophaga varians TaxID=2202339 RepID=A0A847RFG8_9BACT|nr:hypothetical protein [Chitinophaga varians]NLR65809.1 hypothetical protein [Chitinophaga varians]
MTTDLTLHPPIFRTTVDYSYNSSGNAWKIQSILEEITSMGIPSDTTVTYPTYDNKTNFHRLHPLWQFIDRNYSRNNSGSISSYNNAGLPTELSAPALILGIPFQHTFIRYQ